MVDFRGDLKPQERKVPCTVISMCLRSSSPQADTGRLCGLGSHGQLQSPVYFEMQKMPSCPKMWPLQPSVCQSLRSINLIISLIIRNWISSRYLFSHRSSNNKNYQWPAILSTALGGRQKVFWMWRMHQNTWTSTNIYPSTAPSPNSQFSVFAWGKRGQEISQEQECTAVKSTISKVMLLRFQSQPWHILIK